MQRSTHATRYPCRKAMLFKARSITIPPKARAAFIFSRGYHTFDSNKMTYHLLVGCQFLMPPIAPASMGMIGRQIIIDQAAAEVDRNRLKSILECETARKLLASHGVTDEQAKERIDALTDQEVNQLATHFDEQPAGGVIIEAIVIAAIVVVIPELVGITDIFVAF